MANSFVSVTWAFRLQSLQPLDLFSISQPHDDDDNSLTTEQLDMTVLRECINECQQLTASRRVHCDVACVRYAAQGVKTQQQSVSDDTGVYIQNNGLATVQMPPAERVADSAHSWNGAAVNTQPLSDTAKRASDDVNNDVSNGDEHSICRDFCSRSRLTTYDQCVTLLCAKPITDKRLHDAYVKLKTSAATSDAHHQHQGRRRLHKRWPSRISCLEMKCGRFVGNQQKFYDCGVQLCTV